MLNNIHLGTILKKTVNSRTLKLSNPVVNIFYYRVDLNLNIQSFQELGNKLVFVT